jgi:fluoroquinolone resistance protein
VSTLDHLLQEASFDEETFDRVQIQSPLCDKELTSCTFRWLRAEASMWKDVRLEECVFEDCDLTRAQFPRTRFLGVTFRRCKLMGVDWSSIAPNPSLSFDGCDLRYSSFVKMNLRKTVFRGCKASEANFIDCQLGEADFGETDLTGANFEASDLSKANLADAKGAFLAPGKNRVKDARISVETAVFMAMSQGMKVVGYSDAREADGQPRSRKEGK